MASSAVENPARKRGRLRHGFAVTKIIRFWLDVRPKRGEDSVTTTFYLLGFAEAISLP